MYLAITGGIVASFLSVIDGILLEIIAPFWYVAINYGLNPQYSFYGIVGSSTPYPSFFSVIFGSDYFIIFDLAAASAAIAFLIMNAFYGGERTTKFVLRIAVATMLPVFALQIMSLFLYATGYIFGSLWTGLGVNWNQGLSSINSISTFDSAIAGTNPYLDVIEFFFLSGYFLATASLIIVLELRQAILIVLTVLLPAASVLFAVPGLSDYAKKLWKLFFETASFPFITILALYFAIKMQDNFPLQIGFLMLAGSSPFLIVSAFRVFTAGSVMGVVNGLSLERMVGRASSAAAHGSAVAGRALGNEITSSIPGSHRIEAAPVTWPELYKKEYDYRREW